MKVRSRSSPTSKASTASCWTTIYHMLRSPEIWERLLLQQPQLHTLEHCESNYTSIADDAVLGIIARSLLRAPAMRHLRLSVQGGRGGPLNALTNLLQTCRGTHHLDVQCLDDDDVDAMSSGIEDAHPELRQLHLTASGLDLESATPLYLVLQGNVTLQCFSLKTFSFERRVKCESSFLAFEESLSALLAKNSTLTKFQLDLNLEDYPCDRQQRFLNALVVGLGGNRSLQKFRLNCRNGVSHDLSPDVSMHLVRMLEGNTSLREFDWFHYDLESDRAAIRRYLTLNRCGRSLLRDSPAAAVTTAATTAAVRHIPPGLWQHVLAPIVADDAMDALFYFLKHMPRSVFHRGTTRAWMPGAAHVR